MHELVTLFHLLISTFAEGQRFLNEQLTSNKHVTEYTQLMGLSVNGKAVHGVYVEAF